MRADIMKMVKISQVHDLALSGIRVLRFEKFGDERGYFTETFRTSDAEKPDVLGEFNFKQSNESYSVKDVIRGLHFQWNPHMGKLVRTLVGHMVDIVLDIRKNSATFGKVIFYDMPSTTTFSWGEWIWVPPGFAHGNFFLANSQIEYFCTGVYNPKCERSISPLSDDIDFSLADKNLLKKFNELAQAKCLISQKDRDGMSVAQWRSDPDSDQFVL